MNEQESLRERKKARTRASLREHALRLFREQGYQATTVEQIAAAAEVSPSTFFRYFPTKEDVVIQDDMDTRLFAAFDRQPPSLGTVAALRASLREVAASFTPEEMEQLREAFALQVTVPEIRARILDDTSRMMQLMTEALAKRTGRAPDDLAVPDVRRGDVRGHDVGVAAVPHAAGGRSHEHAGDGHVRADRRGAGDVRGRDAAVMGRVASSRTASGMMTCHVVFRLLAARCAGYGCLI